jgi:glutamate 5-kinase
MADPARQEIADRSRTVVVKVGTRVLANEDGTLDQDRVKGIAEQLVQLMDDKRQVVLVSSGAVGAGIGRLGLDQRPTDLAHLQAVAAVGQSRLIESYNRALEVHGRHAAQILLTADDLNDRTRYLNVRNTLLALFQYGALPIINENDTVRVDELQRNVGDNDRLAAMVTNLLQAPLLVLLSDVDGLYDRHPSQPGANVIPLATNLDDAIREFQQQTPVTSGAIQLSRGGMASKLEAARLAVSAGENVVIANGRRPNVLVDILRGELVGTLFSSQGPAVAARKRWIGLTAQPNGRIGLDDGAQTAVERRGRSLLAIGVRTIEGTFQKGDVVSLCRGDGQEFARGLSNYGSDELRRISGHSTEKIVTILGHCPHDEVVHRDNLVIIG